MALVRIPFSGVTESGIEVAHSENMPAIRGFVVAVHPTCDPRIEYGDLVQFERYALEDVTRDEQEYVFVHEDDVVLVIGRDDESEEQEGSAPAG